MTKAWTIRCLAGVVVTVMLGVTACGGGTSDQSDQTSDRTVDSPGPKLTAQQAEIMYGEEVKPASSVQLQPDVVRVEGGPGIIKNVSDNGLTWTVDGNAKGAADLKPGKVMLATSRATGRVVRIEKAGDDLAVLLEPVQLTEIFSELDLEYDEAVDPKQVYAQPMPGLPDAVEESQGEDATAEPTEPSVTPSGWEAGAGAAEAPAGGAVRAENAVDLALPPLRFAPMGWPPSNAGGRSSMKLTVGKWEVEPVYRASVNREGNSLEYGINALYKADDNFKAGMNVSIRATNLRVRSGIHISGGTMKSPTFVLEGLNGITVRMHGGNKTVNGNMKIKAEIPFEWPIKLPPVYGIPTIVVIKFKFLYELGLVGKNSTLTSSGIWDLGGPLGVVAGQLVLPTIKERVPMVKQLGGMPLGPSGVVYGFEFRAQGGVGIPSAYAGPYVKVTGVWGNTVGGAIDTLRGDCKQAVFYVDLAGGYGMTVSSDATGILEKLLGKKIKLEANPAEASFRILDQEDWIPRVAKCKP